MTISFSKPYGSHADCKELEYIATLHQTGNKIRSDGSVTAEDVANFLVSRHGIRVDLSYIEQNLMPSLAGAMDDSSEAVFDIVELASMLLIPHLRKMGALEDEYEVSDFFGKVLGMIISDVTGEDTKHFVLNRDTMREIMEFYGEEDVNDEIIDEMLRAAGADPKDDTNFDYRALLAATTADIQQVKLDWDSTITTHYDDVLDGTTLDTNLEDNDPDEEISKSQFDNAGKQVQRIFTFPTIDFVAENYRSKSFMVLLWLLVIVAFFAYAFAFQTTIGQQDCSAQFDSEFGCRIVNSIISWLLIFAQLTIVGSIFIALSSAGNSIYLQHNIPSLVGVLVGIVSITTSCILSYVFELEFLLINTKKEEDQEYVFAYLFTLFLGCVLLVYQVKALLYVIVPRWVYLSLSFSRFFLETNMAHCESCTKQAAAFKVGKMVENAIGHHEGTGTEVSSHRFSTRTSSRNTSFGQALIHFQATSDIKEPVGGVISTFKKMLDGSLFKEEGVWLHARLYAMNLSQWFIAFFYLVLYVGVYRLIKVTYAETVAPTASPAPSMDFDMQDLVNAISPYYIAALDEIVGQGEEFLSLWWANLTHARPDLVTIFGGGILNYTSAEVVRDIANNTSVETLQIFLEVAANKVDFEAIRSASAAADNMLDGAAGRYLMETTRNLQEDSGDDFMAAVIPTEGVTLFALSMGAVAAFFATVSLAMVWLPSSVSTIQQFRYGAIPSLHDPKFQQYRSGPDLTTILFGSTFWGTFYSSGVIFILIGGLSFVLVWELTRAVMLILCANVIGIFVTIAFKMLILIFVRKALFVGFYRKKPAGGNFTLLIFECWSLGLTLGTMSIRMVKLILISAFYIGRLDTPLFAPGVGCIGPFPLDSYPIQFRKDLLVHEAHRHPYMERLAVIYILKLRYGEDFGTRAGGAWRLISTMALMPWLRRYRLDDGPVADGSDVDEDKKEPAHTAVEDEIKPPTKEPVTDKHDELIRLRNYVKELESRLGKSDFGQHVKATVGDEFLMNEVTTEALNSM